MKKQLLYPVALSVLMIFFGGLSVSAQSLDYLMTIDVPFDFQVSGKVLPAGKYEVRRDPRVPQILVLESNRKKVWEVIHTSPRNLPGDKNLTSLVFKNYGGTHFLSEVRVPMRGEGYAITMSKAERKLAQSFDPKPTRATSSNAANN